MSFLNKISPAKWTLAKSVSFILIAGTVMGAFGMTFLGDIFQTAWYIASGLWSAWEIYQARAYIQNYLKRHLGRIGELLVIFKKTRADEVSNLLGAGDVPLWLFNQLFWPKFQREYGVGCEKESIIEYLLNQTDLSKREKTRTKLICTPIKFLKFKAICTVLSNAHFVDLVIPALNLPGRHIVLFTQWFCMHQNLKLSAINNLLMAKAVKLKQMLRHTPGTVGCYSVKLKKTDAAPWRLNEHLDGLNVIFGTKPVYSDDEKIITGIRIAIRESIAKSNQDLCKAIHDIKLSDGCKPFHSEWHGVTKRDKDNLISGLFINDSGLTPKQIDEALAKISKFCRANWPA